MRAVYGTLLTALALCTSAERAAAEKYKLLNQVIGGVSIEVDTSGMERFSRDVVVGKAMATFGDTADCRNFAVGEVQVAGKHLEKLVLLDGRPFEQYEIVLDLEDVGFYCEIPVCIEVRNGWFSFGESCGKATITSTASDLTIVQGLLAPTIGTTLPEKVVYVDNGCDDAVRLEGITFGGSNLYNLGGLDLTSFIVDSLNGSLKPMALGPIKEALCVKLPELSRALAGFLLDNPLTTILKKASKEFEADPLHLEKMLHETLPSSVNLINIRDNELVKLMFPTRENDGRTIVLTGGIAETIFEKLGVKSGDVLEVLNGFLDLDLLNGGGNTDVMPIVSNLFFQGQPITFAFDMPGFGEVDLKLESMFLDAKTLTENSTTGALAIDLIGDQTVGLPGLKLDKVVVTSKVQMDLKVNTEFMDQKIAFNLTEAPSIMLDWQGFLVEMALLLAVDQNAIGRLQMGPLYDTMIDCFTSTFIRPPTLSGLVAKADAIDLEVSLFDDAIGMIFGDLLTQLFPVYKGMVPDLIESFSASALGGIELMKPTTCARVVMDESNIVTPPYDFSKGMIAELSNFVSSDEVAEQISSALPVDETKPFPIWSTRYTVFGFDLGVLGGDGALQLHLDQIELTRLDGLQELKLLKSLNGSQYLENGLSINDFGMQFVLSFSIGRGNDNTLALSLGADSFALGLDFLATLSQYDVQAKQIKDLLNIDCWIADLDPYGGFQKAILAIAENKLVLDCVNCPNPILRDLAKQVSKPAVSKELFDLLEGSIIPQFLTDLTAPFLPEYWNRTVEGAKTRCAGGSTPEASFMQSPSHQDGSSSPSSSSSSSSPSHDNQAAAFVVLGLLLALVIVFTVFSCRNKNRKHINRYIYEVKVEDKIAEQDSLSVDNRNLAMFNNPEFSKWTKVLVPSLLVVNVTLFIFGHIDVVMRISVQGSVAGTPFAMDNIAEFSILTSTKEMWNTGAKAIAILIILVSIIWPYLKLATLAFTWFAPVHVLAPKRRGKIIHFLDRVSKWSLLELYVVAFVLVVFNIQVNGITTTMFSVPGLFSLAVVVEPAYSLYTFTTALLMSLVMGNVFIFLHKSIVHGELQFGEAAMEKRNVGDLMVKNKFLPIIMVCGTLISIISLLVTSGLVSIVMEMKGVLPTTFEVIGGLKTVSSYSLYSFIEDVFADASAAEVYFGIALVFTVLIIPCVQMCFLIYLVLNRFTLQEAKRAHVWNHILCSWCATEALVLGFILVVLEIETISSGLVSGQCNMIMPFFRNFAMPIGLVSEQDIDAGCFTMVGYLTNGAYGLLVALLLTNTCNLVISKMFDDYLWARIELDQQAKNVNLEPEEDRKERADSAEESVASSEFKISIV